MLVISDDVREIMVYGDGKISGHQAQHDDVAVLHVIWYRFIRPAISRPI
jgi:hypothetical protein